MRRMAHGIVGAAFGLALAAGIPAAAQTRGGTLVFARQLDNIFLDPAHTAQNADIWISLNLYDTLLLASADGKSTEPGLASAYNVSADGKTLTFTMRPGIKFADGSPILVSDVKWSLNRARGKETGDEFAFLLESIDSIETSGDATVAIHMKHADPTILQALATFNAGIMSEKLVMAAPGANLAEKSKAFAEHPIGSGPFVLTSWKRNAELVMSRNQYYWKPGKDGKPLPYLDAVKFVNIPDDATRVLKLKAGEVDAMEFVPYSRVGELKADPKLNMVLFPAAQLNYFALNTRPTLKDGTKNPLNDVRVRQALNYATDKDAMIQVVSYGAGTPQESLMPMSTPYAVGHGAPYPYNPEKAKKLLAEAGYPRGFEVTCMVLAGSADDAAKVASLQSMWSDIGVTLKQEQLEAATRLARYAASDYQMRTGLWTNDINDPNEVTSIIAYYPTRQAARTGWQSKRLDALFEMSQEELDTAKRAAEYKEMQEIYVAGAPIIFSMEVPYPVAMSKKVHDFLQIPLGNNIFLNTYLDK